SILSSVKVRQRPHHRAEEKMRNILKVALAALFCGCVAGAGAQGFPERPVTLVVPWPAGGSTDVALRTLAEAASKHLGQRILIDNRPGAAGTIGPAWMVRNAKPDGYVVSQMALTVFRMPHMTKVDFDPLTDFSWIIHLT